MTLRSRRAAPGGFTLIELMIGIVIGLLSTVVIAHVLTNAEGYRRSAASGSDAQVVGALGLYALQREVQMAGYGLASTPRVLGCELKAQYGGAAIAGFAPRLSPVMITDNGANPDSIRVLSSSKPSYAVPTRLLPPYYDPADQGVGGKAFSFPVVSVLGAAKGDLMVAALDSGTACGVFEVTGDPTPGSLPREDNAGWNGKGFPDVAYGDRSLVINVGTLHDVAFVLADGKLRMREFDAATRTFVERDAQANVVNLQAYYGKDTDANGLVDTYDAVAPDDEAEWQQVRAVRLALVVRSGQYVKEEVTTANPLWDVGTVAAVAGSVDCRDDSKCLELKVDFAGDWKHYRYKVFETVIPLRNLVWKS